MILHVLIAMVAGWLQRHQQQVIAYLVWLKISAVSTPLKLLRLGVYWITGCYHDFHPEERL